MEIPPSTIYHRLRDRLQRTEAHQCQQKLFPPQSGRDSNGRPFSVDIEDLSASDHPQPERSEATGSNPLPELPELPSTVVFGCDSNAASTSNSNCDADSSDLSSLDSLSEFESGPDKPEERATSIAPQFPPRRWWPSDSPAAPLHMWVALYRPPREQRFEILPSLSAYK
jgi:hypothetical protein